MWNLCGQWELEGKSISEKFFAYSEAYLDSAETLCDQIAKSEEKQTYTRGLVVLYLTFHAVELFLKAAILKKAPNEPLNHKIENYEKRYKNLYPAKRFTLEIPFKSEYIGLNPTEIANIEAETNLAPPDQLNKYPVDRNGSEWNEINAFEPYSFLKELINLKAKFELVKQEIQNG